jgi:hypothetical protein
MSIRATTPATSAKIVVPSPLRALRAPLALCAPLEMGLLNLDRGRIHAPSLVDAVGWAPGAPLEVELETPYRLSLRLGRWTSDRSPTARVLISTSGVESRGPTASLSDGLSLSGTVT